MLPDCHAPFFYCVATVTHPAYPIRFYEIVSLHMVAVVPSQRLRLDTKLVRDLDLRPSGVSRKLLEHDQIEVIIVRQMNRPISRNPDVMGHLGRPIVGPCTGVEVEIMGHHGWIPRPPKVE